MSISAGSIPKDAAAVILLRHQYQSSMTLKFFWCGAARSSRFSAGIHAFPGGQFDPNDAAVPVKNCIDAETATAISAAAREMFEETEVLLARGGETLTTGQRASLLDDLQSGRMSWPDLLNHYQLHLDADDFTFVGRWVTPPFSARRFDTWFFLVHCPPKQRAHVTGDAELESGRMDRRQRSLRALATLGAFGCSTGYSCVEDVGRGS